MKKVYSIIRDNNFASMRVAIRNGMKKIDQIVEHYYNLDLVHDVYCIHNFKQKRNEENNLKLKIINYVFIITINASLKIFIAL